MSAPDFVSRLLTLQTARLTGLVPPIHGSFFRYVALNDFTNEKSLSQTKFKETVLADELPLTTAPRLNDPFDVSPSFIDDLSRDDFKRWISQARMPMNINGRLETFDPNRHKVRGSDGVLTDEELSRNAAKVVTDAFTCHVRQAGLASFSRTISSQLMWAHYSKGYTGIAYHFVVSGDSSSILSKLKSVIYSQQRPLIPLSAVLRSLSCDWADATQAAEQLEFLGSIFLCKSADWAYEQEYRIICLDKTPAKFASRELASIIIGPNFPKEFLPILQSIVDKRITPLKIFSAHLSPSTYSIEVDWRQPLYETRMRTNQPNSA